MTYNSIAAMKDALGDIILVVAYDPVAKVNKQFRFEDLPPDGQNAVFRFIATIPDPPPPTALE